MTDQEFRESVYTRLAELQGDLSDSAFSRKIGKEDSYLRGIKRSNSMPSLETLHEICRVFGIREYEFWYQREENETYDQELFYREAKRKIDPCDYQVLFKTLAAMDKDDMKAFANLLRKQHSVE